MDLHKRISESFNKTYGLENPLKGFVDQDKVYWYPTRSNLEGDNIKVYELGVCCEDFYVLDNLIVLLVPEGLRVFRFTKQMRLEPLKTIKHHYLLFLIRKKELNRSTIDFFYKILLYIIKSKTKRLECYLEGVMLYLKAEDVKNVRESCDFIEIEYKDGETKCFNGRLELVNGKKNLVYCKGTFIYKETGEVLTETFRLKPNTLMHLPSKNIYIFKHLVKIEFSSGDCEREIEIKKIEKVLESGKFIFIKNKLCIKVISFE